MSFANGCAYHVWARDGRVNDVLAHEMNESCANSGTAARVGLIAFSLSETEHRIITDGTIVWGTQVVAGRNVATYLPPN